MKKKAHSVEVLFMLVLFSVFSIMSVMLIFIGSNVYGKIIDSQETSANNRMVLSYITNKIRTCQSEDGIFIEKKNGTDVLVITTCEGEYVYETLIFEEGGKLKEATIEAGDDYNLEFGDVLTVLSDFCIEYDDSKGLIKITIENQGEHSSVNVYTGVR